MSSLRRSSRRLSTTNHENDHDHPHHDPYDHHDHHFPDTAFVQIETPVKDIPSHQTDFEQLDCVSSSNSTTTHTNTTNTTHATTATTESQTSNTERLKNKRKSVSFDGNEQNLGSATRSRRSSLIPRAEVVITPSIPITPVLSRKARGKRPAVSSPTSSSPPFSVQPPPITTTTTTSNEKASSSKEILATTPSKRQKRSHKNSPFVAVGVDKEYYYLRERITTGRSGGDQSPIAVTAKTSKSDIVKKSVSDTIVNCTSTPKRKIPVSTRSPPFSIAITTNTDTNTVTTNGRRKNRRTTAVTEMARKGSRATRAAKAKARASMGDEGGENSDGYDDVTISSSHNSSRFHHHPTDEDGSNPLSNIASGSSNSLKKEKMKEKGRSTSHGKGTTTTDKAIDPSEKAAKLSTGSASSPSNVNKDPFGLSRHARSAVDTGVGGVDDGDGHSEDDEEDGDEEDENDLDEEDDEEEDDDEEAEDDDDEEYEHSLSMLAADSSHGRSVSEYRSGDSSAGDTNDTSQHFDADGSPIPSAASLAAVEAAMEAAAEAGLGVFGAGGSSSFRALQGIMSGMSSRIKGLLATLRSKSENSSSKKLIALQDLTELLSVSTEDTLAGYFQVEAFAKEFVLILKCESSGMKEGSGTGSGGMSVEEMMAFGISPEEQQGGSNEENNVQMMLLACRCLANLMEALPGSAHSIVYAGAVPVLCSKLLEIQYIDLAEQTLSTLEKISEEVPSSIVREGGLGALLTYLDFFSFHVQRTAVTAAANCCRSLSLDSFSMVRDVMPILTNVLGYPDQRVVEQACLAVVRIVESYRHYPDKLETLLSSNLLIAIRALLNPDSTTIGPGTYTQILKMLSIAARASPEVSISLIELNIAATLYHLLTGVAPPEFTREEGAQALGDKAVDDDLLVMQNLVQRPKEQIHETLGLVCELLPALPKDGVFSSRPYTVKEKERSSKSKLKQEDLGISSLNQDEGESTSSSTRKESEAHPVEEDHNQDKSINGQLASSSSLSDILAKARANKLSRDPKKEAANDKRMELLSSDLPSRVLVVKRYYALLLPTLVDVYSASVNAQVRQRAVLGLLKIINFSDPDTLANILRGVAMSSFLAAILSSRDQNAVVVSALQLVELLLVKIPDAYQYFFRREGVMHEIERLAEAPLLCAPKTKSKRSSPSRTPIMLESSQDPFTNGPSGLTRALQRHDSGEQTSPSPKLSVPEQQAQDLLTLRAKHLCASYANANSDSALKARKELDDVKQLAIDLEAPFTGPEASGYEEAENLADRVAAMFSDETLSLSSFEILQSGLVDALLKFASQEQQGSSLPLRQRKEVLAKALLPHTTGKPASSAFALLVKRLQESLSRMEEFEVILAAQSSTDAELRRNGPSMLARQLKLRLVAEEGSDIPRSCTNIVVSIHAIATFQAFNDYLRPRILAATSLAKRTSGSSSAPQVGGGDRLAGFLAAFAAANGVSSSAEGNPNSSVSRLSSSLGTVKVGQEADASPETPPSKPIQRRSRRLSDKAGLRNDLNSSVEAKTSEETKPSTSTAHEDDMELDQDEDDEDDDDEEVDHMDEDDNLFADGFDATLTPRDDRPVNLEVAEDGSKVVAKTPDGTRVGTPTHSKPSSSAAVPSTPKPRATSYAAAVKAEPTDFHLEFSLSGHDVGMDTTIYGAVHNYEALTPEARRNMWHTIFTVKFKKVAGPDISEDKPATTLISSAESIIQSMPSSIPKDSQQAKILTLLWVLYAINAEYGDEIAVDGSTGLTPSAFVNNKLTAKLNRQLEEPMIVASGCLPDWALDLPQFFPFLFPFDTRYNFLQSTAFGYARLMQKWVGQARADNSRRDDNLGFLGRLQRQKVRISRDRMLESAIKVFELYGSSRASLEVEFFNEVGSGLGPTLEFYALVSKEFARKDLLLWRDDDVSGPSPFVHSQVGFFPSPMDDMTSEAGKKRLKTFRVLGQFVAKALMDSRIVDVNFSLAFMKLALGHELALTIANVRTIDRELAKSLAHLEEYLSEKRVVEANESLRVEQKAITINHIQIRGATVDDLTLDFTLPGQSIELKESGKDIAVSMENLEEYISLVVLWTLRKGVMMQVEEFKAGFSSVFPIGDLKSFAPSELVMMTGVLNEDWSIEGLTNATKADHGFTIDSRSVRDLLSIMSELSLSERREFLSFITGAPRLPIGGFAALTPALTIVRKDGGDGSLPSVMTCVNYIKLPDYSSREVVKERVMTAVREGAGGFHLS